MLEYLWYFVRAAGIDSAQAAAPLQPWLGAARTLDPTRRAAALVIADAVLAEALPLDSLRAFGDSGRAVLLVSGLARGGRRACGLNPPWVVSEGERLLQSITDRSLLTELHFVLGDALDESSPRDELERPLAHYRAGLALDSTSSRASEAWHRAWWILVHGRRSGPRSDLVWC